MEPGVNVGNYAFQSRVTRSGWPSLGCGLVCTLENALKDDSRKLPTGFARSAPVGLCNLGNTRRRRRFLCALWVD